MTEHQNRNDSSISIIECDENVNESEDLISLIEVDDGEDENGSGDLISLIEVDDDEEENESDDLVSLIESEERRSEQEEKRIRPNEVKLKNMRRVVRSWMHCFACGEKKNLHRPPKNMRLYFCREKKVYIEKNDRVCDHHLQRQNWNNICYKSVSKFSSKIIDEMVSFLVNDSKEGCVAKVDMGLTDPQFEQVLSELGVSDSNKVGNKTIMAIRTYLERLRLGHTYKQIGSRHGTDRRVIGKMVNLGRQTLLHQFVPNHLGYANRTRQWLINHTSQISHLCCPVTMTGVRLFQYGMQHTYIHAVVAIILINARFIQGKNEDICSK